MEASGPMKDKFDVNQLQKAYSPPNEEAEVKKHDRNHGY